MGQSQAAAVLGGLVLLVGGSFVSTLSQWPKMSQRIQLSGPQTRIRALIALIVLTIASIAPVTLKAAEGPRVKWGGVMFRGKAEDRTKLYPMLSDEKVVARLQKALSDAARETKRTDCDFFVDGQFNLAQGDGLVMGCVIEDEDFVEAKAAFDDHDEYYGQLIIAASLVVFNFQQGIVVSSSIVSTMLAFGSDSDIRNPATIEDKERYLNTLVFTPNENGLHLIGRVTTAMSTLPIKEKANFGRLQVNLPEMDDQSLKEFGALDAVQSQRVRRQFSQKIAASLTEEFRLNVLPIVDGDSTLQTMTISFADKSKISKSGETEKVFSLMPPTIVAEISISNTGNSILKKYSTLAQTAITFQSDLAIKFIENGKPSFEKRCGYGVNRAFAPDRAEAQAVSVKRLFYRKAVEDGFQKQFIEVVGKDKKWKLISAKLAM